MSYNSRRLAAGILLTAFAWGAAGADEVVLKTGERRQGRVESITGEPDHLMLISGSQQIRIPRDRVERVIEQSDAEDYTILGGQFAKTQNFDRAIQMYQLALEADQNYAPARAGMDEVRRMVSDRQAEALRRQQSQNSDNLSRARDLIREEKYAEAETLLNAILMSNPTSDQQAAAQLSRRDLYLAWSRDREDKLDPIGAETYLQKVLEIDPENPQARDLLLRVWERNPAKRQELLAIYQAKMAETPDDLVVNQKYADLLFTLNRGEEAVEPLKTLYDSGRFRALGYDQRLMDALRLRATKQATAGDLDAAIGTYSELLEIFPSADRSPLVYLNYEKRLKDIAPDDWHSRAALLSDLSSQGMKAFALQEAEYILRNDPENKIAAAMLRAESEDRLAEIQDAMNRNQFVLAKSLARNFAQQNYRFPELVQTAVDLHTRAELEAQRQAKQLRDQARDVVAQGDLYLAEAKQNATWHKSAENQNRSRLFSYKNEAEKFARRAIEAYQIALQIDPSVGPLVGGMDVDTKLADARDLLAQLTRSPIDIRLPQGRERRRTTSNTTPQTGTP